MIAVRQIALSILVLPALCAVAVGADPVAPQQGERPHSPASGYLAPGERPDSRQLLPPPPTPGSPAMARDTAAADRALHLRASDRWTLAQHDADLSLPKTLGAFSCAVGTNLAAQPSPRLTALLSRALPDIAYSTFAAKDQYRRARPFTVNHDPTCTPEIEDRLIKDGSYPSGHSAIGWGIALILSELAPDKTNEIIARGRAFGESRVICNVHWLSDVEEGRTVAAAVVARLHANAQFRADAIAAEQELTYLRRQGGAPRDCAAQAKALSES